MRITIIIAVWVMGSQGYAAFDVNNMFLDLTGYDNVIHHKSNGVVAARSDVTVLNCTFHDIQPDAAYTLVGNGAGINCHGLGGWHLLKQEGFGNGASDPASFTDCRWGIYTQYMSLWSAYNHMDNVGTAYRVEKSGMMDVDILGNRVECQYHGIDLRFNDGAQHVLVESNEVTFGGVQCDFCKGYTGILVSEGNYASNNSRILNNTIRFLPVASSRIGIGLTAADDWLVADNTLLMASNAHNLTGIYLNGCKRTEVSCNAVTGASAVSFPLESQSAIRNVMGGDALINCNDMDLTTNGILFNGVAPNTDVLGNRIRRHKWGLHLDGTAIIGAQALKGNLWYQQAATGGLGAWYEDTLNAVNNLFLVNPTTISGGNTMPPSVWPSGWFDQVFGTNYDCADDESEDYCSQFNQRGKEKLTELDEQVASDSLQNDPYTDETKWMLKGRLYKKLDENPELVDSLEVMANLYDELQGSTTADFKMIDDDQVTLYSMDSTAVSQLHANRTEIEALMSLLMDGLEQLGDSTLTSSQRQAILDGISWYHEDIRDLYTWSTTTLQTASGSKAEHADEVRATNAGVVVDELIEANEKTVNEIYLATIGKDVDEFTTMQATELFDIANQCPMLGGNTVFKARSLYWLIDDSYDFDDASICLPHGIVVKRMTEKSANAVSVVPNPATDEASLILTKQMDAPGVFVLFDAFGAEVMQHVVPVETKRFAFSTRLLAPAVYHYRVHGLSGVVGNGKLTIVR